MSAGSPDFFVDRSLGRRQVPDLLRAAGVRLHTLAEVYGIPADETVDDVDWLAHAGAQGWPVLLKDERIRYRAAEREALLGHAVKAFCLNRGDLRAAQMAEAYIRVLPRIVEACQAAGPFLYVGRPAGHRAVICRSTDRPGPAGPLHAADPVPVRQTGPARAGRARAGVGISRSGR